jgi:ubiquinol-cytochrome c reductase cytochrome c subunit
MTVKKLSRLRRRRITAPVLLLLALIVVGNAYAFIGATVTTPGATASNARTTMIEEGREIFLKGCSSCHGLNADGAGIAPALVGVGAASVDFQVGTGRMPMADMSQQAMRKTPFYNEAETAALAEYVASLAPGPAIPGSEMLMYERDGNVAEGGELFRTNCAMCHNAAGQGGALTKGKYAPTVMGVSAKHIYEAMITGPQAMPVFGEKAITPEEKLSIIKWIKYTESEKAVGGASLGKVGPVTEGLVAWVLGIGLLIGIAVWLTTKSR